VQPIKGKPHGVEFAPFVYVGRTIYVEATVSGPRGVRTGGDFILDTGTNRSAVTPDVVGLVGLQISSGSRVVSAIGRSNLPLSTVPKLEVMGFEVTNLQANVRDMDKFSRLYQRLTAGLLGMDVLQNLVTIIDYPRRRIALTEAHQKMKGMKEVAKWPIELKEGLDLVSADLPGDAKINLIVDTGCDFPEDIALYKEALGGIKLSPPLSSRTVGDGFSEATGESGQLPSVDIGQVRLAPVNVFVYPSRTFPAGQIVKIRFRHNATLVDSDLVMVGAR
jgi:Aspartyl protease